MAGLLLFKYLPQRSITHGAFLFYSEQMSVLAILILQYFTMRENRGVRLLVSQNRA